ncbi:MAG: heparan-alpha-glucosaminide N-acetyltransferase domain-containing protein, partial [Polyangiaceae bacterium]
MTEPTGIASDAETTTAGRRGTARDGAQRGRSDVAVDAFRGIVVVMMFAVHARRIQAGHGDGALERAADVALRFLMRIEPYIAASFLYLVGFSLLLSWSASASRVSEAERPELARRWRARMFKRAAWLYALSVGLCLPQFGLQWPATFVSSGILSVIALAIVCCAALLTFSGGRRVAWPLCVLVLLVTSGLHFAPLGVSGINAGPGGTFPLLAASLLGMQSSSLQGGSPLHGGSSLHGGSLAAEPPLRATRLRSPWTLMCLAIAGYELLRG